QLDGRGLARTVRAKKPEDLPAMDLKIEGLERLNLRASPEIAIDLGEVSRFDDNLRSRFHHEGAVSGKGSHGMGVQRKPGLSKWPETELGSFLGDFAAGGRTHAQAG